MNGPPLSDRFPAGCYFGFNAMIDRKTAESIANLCSDAIRNGYSEINLCISSTGGMLVHTYYLVNIIDALPAKIVTYNIGSVESAANLLFLCGDVRYAAPGTTFFFHQTAWDMPPGERLTEALVTARLKGIQYDDNRSAAIMATKTGQTLERVRDWQNTELVMPADDALINGIIHEVRALSIPKGAFFQQVIV